jgi:hypothetical protein
MLARLVIAFIVASAVYGGLRILFGKKKLSVNQFFQIYFAVLIGIVLFYMALSGKLHPLFAVLGASLPFLARLISWIPRGFQLFTIFRHLKGFIASASAGQGGNQGQKSEINTRYLHMVLFHDTGMMDGEVLLGQFTGARLSMLEQAQLMELLQECRSDPDSLSVLEAFLDREHDQWREQTENADRPAASSDGPLSESQAYEILGITPDASRDDVIQAHRRLMQKLHPDRGGSTYLAARINTAKDLLLDKLGKH